jgi:hypothetical protein
MNDLHNNDIKANAQAGAVNISTNDVSFQPTVNLGINGSGDIASFPARFIRNARKALNPIGAARDEAEMRNIEASSIADVVAIYKRAFPTFTDGQLYLMAHGYNASASQADNLLNVLERAGKMSDSNRVDELPESCIDLDIHGAQTAYDDQLREMWAKLISQEVSSGSARSKRTKKILEQMDSGEASQLFSILRCCLWAKVGPNSVFTPIPVLLRTSKDDSWTYNGGTISSESVVAMASLGLLSTNNWTTFTLAPKGGLNLYSSSSHVLLINNKDEKIDINLGYAKFLKPGIELIEILDVPMDDRLMSVMDAVLETDVIYKPLD